MPDSSELLILETPRDAMQGIKEFIPTEKKVEYINQILKAGFGIVEVGSLVSAAAIPQMRDTVEVIRQLDLQSTKSKLMVLVANRKGFDTALELDEINYIAYPYSASPRFLGKNINRCPKEALDDIEYFSSKALNHGKELMIYLSMAFGNPYGDPWSPTIILKEAEALFKRGVYQIPLSDITGEARPERITAVFSMLKDKINEASFGLHMHSKPEDAYPKLEAAWEAGCRHFDTVVNGLGGCPMTGMELLSNLNTFQLIDFLEHKNIDHQINTEELRKCILNG